MRRMLVYPCMNVAWLTRPYQEFPVPEVAQHPQTGARALAIIAAATLAMLVDGTANTAITTGLPYIQGLTAATPDESSWLVTLFNGPYYATILFTPWLYARFGRKPLLLFAIGAFVATSLALSLADTFGLVAILRMLQGIALGCVFVPAAILLFSSLPLDAMVLAIPAFALISLGAGTLGTLVGGYYSETYGASVLYLPSAVAMSIAGALIWVASPKYDAPQPHLRIDAFGIACALVLFGTMQYIANEGERRNWFDDPTIWFGLVIIAVSGGMLILWELFGARYPFANFRMFAEHRNLAVGGGVNFILGSVGYSITVFAAYLESAVAATATLAGLMIALRLCTYVLGIALAFLLVSRRILDVRIVVSVAAVATAVSLVLFGNRMTTTAEAASFVAVSLLFGLFYSMMSQPVPSLVLGSLPREQLAAGLSIYKLTSPIGLMVATALMSTFIDHRATAHVSDLAGFITPHNPAVAQFLHRGGSLKVLAQLAAGQAQTLAYRDAMFVFAGVVLGLIPLVALVRVQRPAA